jgi:diguanylate cyclase (GGDEF)-like protein/PAS domain S-box-containing protein
MTTDPVLPKRIMRNGANRRDREAQRDWMMKREPARKLVEHGRRKRLFIKLCIIVSGVTMALLAVAGAALIDRVERSEYEEASGNLLNKGRTIRSMLRSTHGVTIVAVDKLFEVFAHELRGEWSVAAGRRLRLGQNDVAPLSLSGETVLPGFAPVDEFTRKSGGHAATIFVRHGDDFLRLATSLPDTDGSRATGTTLQRDHPGYRGLLQGEPYVGYAKLFDRPYMTRYQPIVDAAGRVIGALFVGLDLSASIAQIGREIGAMEVGRTGYVFVVDSGPGPTRGELVIHPRYPGKSAFAVVPASAQAFVDEVLRAPDGRVGTYAFADEAGAPLQNKIAAFAEFPEWHWIIGVGTNLSEFSEQREHLQVAVVGGMLLAGASIVVLMSLALGRYVLAPMLALESRLRGSEERFRSVVDSSNDVIFTIDADGRYDGFFGRGIASHVIGAESQLGRLPTEVLGESGRLHEQCHARALAGEHVTYESTVEQASGQVDFHIALAPIHDADGAVCGAVGIARDITERKRAEAQARFAAQHDALTGLPNRTLLDDRLGQALSRARRNGTQVGVYYIDLDHFKEINDRLGHETGDRLLCDAAARFLRCVRHTDTVGRLGGDEFIIVLDGSDEAALLGVADKLIAAFHEPFVLAGESWKISLSIGLCRYPADGQDADKLLQLADAAMYRAKDAGRNTYRCATGADVPGETIEKL